MKTAFYSIFLVLFLTCTTFSQKIIWEKRYYLDKYIALVTFAENKRDNSVIVSGLSGLPSAEFISKIDTLGEIEWIKPIFIDYLIQFTYNLSQNSDGTIRFVGAYSPFVDSDDISPYTLFRYDISQQGDSISQYKDTTYYTIGYPRYIRFDDAHLLYTLRSYDTNNLVRLYFGKIDTIGYPLWKIPIQDSSNLLKAISSPCKDGDGFVAASRYTNSNGQNVIVLIKIDTAGNEMWRENIQSDYKWYSFKRILPTFDGGYLIAGTYSDKSYLVVMKINHQRVKEWEIKYIPENFEFSNLKWIKEKDNGDVIISGYAGRFNSIGGTDEKTIRGFITRFNKNGELVWEFIYGKSGVGTELDYVLPLKDNFYISVGLSQDSIIVLKLSDESLGVEESINQDEIFIQKSSESFEITSVSEINKILVYNVIGNKLIEIDKPNLKAGKVNINDLSPGVYFIVIYNAEGKVTKRSFIKY